MAYLPVFFSDMVTSFRLALRAKVVSLIAYSLAIFIIIVLLAIEFSARQLSTVALDVGFSLIRIILPILMVLLVQDLFSKEFERKLYLSSLTYPRSRSAWLLSRVFSIFIIGCIALVVMSIVLVFLTLYAEARYAQATPVALGFPYVIALSFVALDTLVVLAIATLLAMSAKTPSFVLVGTLGLTIIARSYTPIIELLRGNPYTVAEHVDPKLYQDSLSMIAFILPDLGRLDVRMIALYDKMVFFPSDWSILLAATVSYVIALFGISIWVLNKREFS